MRDIPLFTTDAGVAALTLSEIPYRATAYIRLLDATDPEGLLDECIRFCRMAGAQYVYATGHEVLEQYPLHTTLLQLCRLAKDIGVTDATLIPVSESTLSQWREIFNERMRNIPNAATMTTARSEEILKENSGYFVYRNELLLGIGVVSGEKIAAVASVERGAGKEVFLALCSKLTGEQVVVEVAANNERACRLYRELGFAESKEISRWYQILP